MLSDRLETFTSELLTFFNPLPFVVTSFLLSINTIVSELPTFWVIGGACANSRYQAHLQCGLGSRLALQVKVGKVASFVVKYSWSSVQPL